MSSVNIQRHGNWEYKMEGGREWKRRVGTSKWVKLDRYAVLGFPGGGVRSTDIGIFIKPPSNGSCYGAQAGAAEAASG